MRSFETLTLVLLSFTTSLLVATDRISTPQATARLVWDKPHSENRLALGVEFRLKPEWHIYWKNPGDSGTAPKFQFKVDGGTIAGPQWPGPERIPLGDLTNYGYSERVVFPFTIDRTGAAAVKVGLDLEFLVCKVECIPATGQLETNWPSPTPGIAPDARHPLPSSDNSLRLAALSSDAEGVTLALESDSVDPKSVKRIDIFPENGELFETRAPRWEIDGKAWTAKLRWAANAPADRGRARFLATLDDGQAIRAVELESALTPSVSASLLRALALAFLGGILLNLMPCVFPVLSLKVLSFIKEGESGGASVRKSAWLYAAGVLVSFLLLAGLLLVLRAGGEQLGWGFQLQSPAFVTAMAFLFFLIALNFLGVFDVGYALMNWSGSLGSSPILSSSFGTGVLATLVATPCTAPFMGSAVGASLLLPPLASLAIFASLGAGMAAPLVALSYFPAAMNRLPRAGLWMERFKQLLAFPVLATVVWMGWVLVQQSGPEGFLVLSSGLLGSSFALWLWRASAGKLGRAFAGALLGASLVAPLVVVKSSPAPAARAHAEWAPYDATAIQKAREEGLPVFIDFTAAWCLTCQWNKRSVLHTQRAAELFSQHRVRLIEADWTDGNPTITAALAEYGRNSVPLYVFLPPKGEPIILPELLTIGMIEGLFSASAP